MQMMREQHYMGQLGELLDLKQSKPEIVLPDWPQMMTWDKWTVAVATALSLNISPEMVHSDNYYQDVLETIWSPGHDRLRARYQKRLQALLLSSFSPDNPYTLIDRLEVVDWFLKNFSVRDLPSEFMTSESFKVEVCKIVADGGLVSIRRNKVAYLFLNWVKEGVEEDCYKVSGTIEALIGRIEGAAGDALGNLFSSVDDSTIRRDLSHKPKRTSATFNAWAEHHKPIYCTGK